MVKVIESVPEQRLNARPGAAVDWRPLKLLQAKDNPRASIGRDGMRQSMAAPVRERLKLRVAHLSFLLTRPLTLGVRAVVIDKADRVLLVRHGYVSGWHFPGGGVEAGESCMEALARELKEETCVALDGPPELHGLFFNARLSRRDHVAVYVIRAFSLLGERAPDREIQEVRFFPRSALPEGTTRGTRTRLEEIFASAPLSGAW
jgi:ADP-ribose pyrophosphatase YjhB (NUDIX family)